jgi:hypothetical protein
MARIRLWVPFPFHKILAVQDGTSGPDPTLVSLNPHCPRLDLWPGFNGAYPSVGLILVAHLEFNSRE